MSIEEEKEEPKKFVVDINDKFKIESSHEVVITLPYKGDKPFDENYVHEVKELTSYEIEMLKGTKSVDQLLKEEREELEKPKPELSEDEKIKVKKKELITKVKVIALDSFDKHPLANPSFFSMREKSKLMSKMQEILDKSTEDEICEQFNKVCTEVLFVPGANVENYTIYSN